MTEPPSDIALSVVIPVKGNAHTLAKTVASLLDQDLDQPFEVIVVVDAQDAARRALEPLAHDPRVRVLTPPPFPVPGARDANWRRAIGLLAARGRILALTDADMVFEPDWARTALDLFEETTADCVAGVMEAMPGTGFWGRYTDVTALGAKTPRFRHSQWLSLDTLGRRNFKPPVTANLLLRREVVERVLPRTDITYSYEDYAFAQDLVDAGYSILCTDRVTGRHHHRHDVRSLVREYVTAGRGCGQFVRAYPSRRLAIRRLEHLATVLVIPIALILGLLQLAPATLVAMGAVLASVEVASLIRSRHLEGVVHAPITLALGIVFSLGFARELVFGGPVKIAIDAEFPRRVFQSNDRTVVVDLRDQSHDAAPEAAQLGVS